MNFVFNVMCVFSVFGESGRGEMHTIVKKLGQRLDQKVQRLSVVQVHVRNKEQSWIRNAEPLI